MTDREIINVLTYCNTAKTEHHCVICPFYEYKKCTVSMLDSAVDLINRQKAEIERLSCRVSDLAEIEKEYALKYGNNHDVDIMKKFVGQNVIKEFAEKLRDKLSECHTVSDEYYEFTGYDCEETITAIDNLTKEMMESD